MDPATPIMLLAALFFATACIYSMAGLGGASTYLALLILTGASFSSIAPVALLCNILVTAGSLVHFFRGKMIPFRVIVPFLMASVPMAFIGGLLPVKEPVVKSMLAACLFVAGLYLLNYNRFKQTGDIQIPKLVQLWPLGILTGGVIGFVSGMVGIGGGIFLAPLLYLFRWIDARKVAAATSLFILVNSVAGLFGQVFKTSIVEPFTAAWPLFIAVFLGSQVGSMLSVFHLKADVIRLVSAFLVILASIRIVWSTW